MIWPLAIAVAINIGHAFYDARKMKKNIRIRHGVTGVLYFLTCVFVAICFENIWFTIPMLLIRPVVFDPVLNMATNHNPFHVSMTTTSLIDKWERRITTNGVKQWLGWLAATGISITLIYIL